MPAPKFNFRYIDIPHNVLYICFFLLFPSVLYTYSTTVEKAFYDDDCMRCFFLLRFENFLSFDLFVIIVMTI